MRTTELVSELRKQNITLRADNGQLMLSGPKGALTPEMRAELLDRKEEILNFLKYVASSSVSNTPPLQPVFRDRILPLSFAQQRLWFLDQYEPNSPLYNIPGALRLRGYLNIGALEHSVNEIIRRHESLRTTFSVVDGEPIQVIAPSVGLSLSVVDLLDRPDSEREEEAHCLARDEARRPFDLAGGPLFRASLILLGEDDHMLLLAMHHIVSDGWSMGVFHRELSVLYQAFQNGQPSPLPELPFQYADFAVWQRQWLQGEVLDRQLSYWKRQLEGIPAVLNLPTDHPRPAVQSYRGAYQSIELSQELTKRLKALSRKEDATLFMILLAAFQTLLYRYTGQEDIVVGSPIANRNRTEIEGLIGFFVNTLVLRSNFDGDPTFKELLARVRETALGAYAHQDLPFERLVEELQPERSLSHSPLFQVMFVLQNAPHTALQFEGLRVTPVRSDGAKAKFDLTVFMHERGHDIRGSIEYATDLFDEATVVRMMGHFKMLLDEIVTNPERRISELTILTESERHQLSLEWNDTKRDYPITKCVHELFEEQVEKSPDAVAAVFEVEQLSYQELNERANQLAHRLIKNGVGPDVLVAICMERSLEMVVGILGVLKAGGGYVPLDPSYPEERLAFMLEDSAVSVVLTQTKLLSQLSELTMDGQHTSGTEAADGVESRGRGPLKTLSSVIGSRPGGISVICPDASREGVERESEKNPTTSATADSLVYVIYTSGSTGRPKGVAMRHRSLCNLISWQVQNAVLGGARTLQFASLSFDVSFQEIFSTWCSGGTLVLVSEELRRDAVALLSLLEDTAVERLFVPSVALDQLAEVADGQRQFPSKLREIITAGEQLRITPQIAGWFGKSKNCSLQNQYGPSESHVVTAFALTGSPCEWPTLPPIGRPISNSSIYLLDSHLQPVPVGIPGELYIGGDCLARGYLNRPELTAERFIVDPFGKEAAGRLYKTGDLARYLPDGNIEFLGRIDNQVKIRGFRIEPGEIETVLRQHSAVHEAIVLARGDPSDGNQGVLRNLKVDQRLVAYVVPRQEQAPTISELRGFLREKLPEYMVPSTFVLLDTLPLTPNGKVDRQALPAPDQRRPEVGELYVAPRTPVEEMIADIWAEVLKLDTVGVHDNFFDLGGHSLLATQAMSRTCGGLQVELPLRALFEGPTVAEMAKRVNEAHGEEPRLSTPPIVAVSRDRALPLSFSQQRLWFLDQYEPNSSVYNLPSALRLGGTLDAGALEQSLIEIIRRHESLRTTFSMVEGEPIQVIAPSLSFSVPVLDLRDHPESEREEEARRLVSEEARRPFDLARGPLFRSQLLRLGEDDHVLLLSMHHIVSDGWSMAIFFRELSALYGAFANGQPSPLPELPIQYADYAVWQRNWLQGDVLETQLSYWRQQLKNVATLNLVTDRPRPPIQTFHGGRESQVLSKDLSQVLRRISRKQGASLFMTLLAVLQLLLHRLTGQDDIAVGSPIAGRNRAETESLIGFFLNTLVLRTNLSDNPTFLQLLDQVRGVCLEAYAHQDVPFEKLLEELRSERDLSRTPFFQVFLNMVNVAERVKPAGLKIETLPSAEVESKFDLTIYVREHNGALQLNWVYNSDLFDRERIQEMLSQYEKLLTQISEQPANSVQSYSLLTAAAQELLPNPVKPLAADWVGSVHDKLSQHARLNPDHVAITDPRGSWTYAELNAKSNQLAHYLLASGIQREEIVAVYAHRSAALAWALLGVLKAGAAFLILDPAYPTARLIQYVRGAQPRGLISLDGAGAVPTDLARVLEATIRCRVALPRMSEPGAGKFFENCSSADPEIEIRPDDLAYISYTSGSTGEPKGVQGTHGPLSHFLPWQAAHFGLTCADRFSLLSGLSHDPLHREILTAFWVGATLCIPDPDFLGTSGELPAWMAQQRISFAHLTPALGRLLAESAKPESKWPSLRYAFFIGDKLTRRDIACLRRLAPQATNVNYYGSTETQRAVSYHEISPQADDAPGGSVLPVGHGMPGAQLLVLTRARNLTGIGEVGEIYMRSPHLARGYLGDPSRTQARFVTNPFTRQAHDRMYQTGDLGRYLRDGSVEVLGRTDGQINIRGFRVETGEIEFALSQCPAVRDVVVVARDDAGGDKQLIAYVVAAQEPALSIHQLRSFLKQRLPDHMMPSAFVTLESLPLTPNGKVDRRALPAPEQSRRELEEACVAPRTPVEEIIAEIWAQVLELDTVGVHDKFFDLGGHSLLATQAISRICQVFQKELPLRALFEGPTVAELAKRIEETRSEEPKLARGPIVPAMRDQDLPLSFSQQRLWFLDQYEPNSSLYNIPGALRLRGTLDVAILEQSLNEIIHRHESLRTTFSTLDGEPVQVIAPSLRISLDLVDLRYHAESEREEEGRRLVSEEGRRPFDLAKGPLFRSQLLRLGEDDHVLLMTMHHIVSDGWSMGILYRELSVLYGAYSQGKPSSLPDLSVQYADFAVWQRQWLQGEVLDRQLSYWKRQLEGIPAVLSLPTDRPRPVVQSFRGNRQSIELSRGLTRGLKALSRKEDVTLYMTLLAAFQTLLYRYTGQEDIVVGSPIANRYRTDIEGLIGFFVNTLVLRSNFSGEPTFKQLLAQVRETALGAYAHQDLPYEKLVEVLHPKRATAHRPLVQIAFAFQNMPRQPLTLPELTVSRLQTPLEIAKLDLTLFMWETEEELAGSLDYSTDLFDDATIGRMQGDFQTLLAAVVADPNRHLVDLPRFQALAAKTVEVSPKEKLDVFQKSNLTKNQLLIWAGQKLQPETPLYNVVSVYTLTGKIDAGHFQNAFRTLLKSSDVLRTVIQEIDEIPRQKILSDFPYELEYLDFSKDSEPRAAFQTWVQARCRVQFNLEERLIDCVLAKLTESQFVWYLNQHHIITDGWSNSLIFRWMSEFYQRSIEGRLEQRITLPSFQDYIDYEREFRTSPQYLEAQNYWQRKLAEEFEPVNFYGKTPLERTSQVQRISYDLGTERTQSLKCLASREEISGRTEHASMFYIFATLLLTYLYRATGNRHLSIGTPYHNRSSKAFRDTLGLIMEVLPLRTTIGETDTFVSLIQKIRFEASQAFRYSQTIANSPQNKVYDVVLNYHTASFPMFGGASAQREWVHTGYENDSLALQIHDFAASGSLVLDFDFQCAVFNEEQRAQTIQHFVRVLDAFLEDSTQPLHRVTLLSPEEREQILVEFNHTGAALPHDRTIPQIFEAQVQNRPDQLAVVFEDQSLSYGQLNAKANKLAHYLQSLGVGPEVLVGISVEPSLNMIVGILGILKAGGAYLPLDPAYPRERVSFMLLDAQVPVLLTHDRLLGDLPEYGGRVVCLDTDWGAIADNNEDNPANAATADMLAYVIYTSGSTGKAKGVTIQHSGVCNRLLWGQKFYRLEGSDRVLQKSSFAYDASVWEIFEPLLAGAQVVMARPGGRQDSAYLVELMAEQKVSVAEFVPSMIGVLLEEKGIERCSSLKRVFSGGEALSVEIRDRFAARLSSDLYNTYGPTEASIDVAHFKCRPGTNQWTVPIGRPIANTQIYILDSHLNPVPNGLPGELHIGSIGLARGYLNRPELTAEKFIPNPFSDAPGARLYKTGDLALYLPDGNIEFLGRIDHQVKIRGFRIELEEIEAVLRQHPAVHDDVVVVACDDAGGDKQLIAYVVAAQEPALSIHQLRSFLKQRLPDHMIPSAFVTLESLPLTPNGKVDRRALPAPDYTGQEQEAAPVAPRDGLELQLRQIWEKVLRIRPIGVKDNFFDLGGHSLLAVRLFAQIEKVMEKRLPVAALFHAPTIEQLAGLISDQGWSAQWKSLVAIQPGGSKPPLFCVHAHDGGVLFWRDLARHLGPDQPIYALQPQGLDGREPLHGRIEEMAAHYVKEVRRLQPEGPYFIGGHCLGGLIAFEMAQQLQSQGERVALLALVDSFAPRREGFARRSFFRRYRYRAICLFERTVSLHIGHLAILKPRERLPYVKSKINKALNKLYMTVGAAWVPAARNRRKVLHAGSEAARHYNPGSYPGKITLFRAAKLGGGIDHDPQMGWSRLAGEELESHLIPGYHAHIVLEPRVRLLAKELIASLRRAQEIQEREQILQEEPSQYKDGASVGKRRIQWTQSESIIPRTQSSQD